LACSPLSTIDAPVENQAVRPASEQSISRREHHEMRYAPLLVTMGVLWLAACSSLTSYNSGGGGGSGGGHSTTITVGNDFFSPTPDTVSAGAVTFTWSTPSAGHTLIWDSAPGTLPTDQTVAMTSGSLNFTSLQAGTYQFHCSIHGGVGTGMHGTLVVQ
jgi:plastocyanin